MQTQGQATSPLTCPRALRVLRPGRWRPVCSAAGRSPVECVCFARGVHVNARQLEPLSGWTSGPLKISCGFGITRGSGWSGDSLCSHLRGPSPRRVSSAPWAWGVRDREVSGPPTGWRGRLCAPLPVPTPFFPFALKPDGGVGGTFRKIFLPSVRGDPWGDHPTPRH